MSGIPMDEKKQNSLRSFRYRIRFVLDKVLNVLAGERSKAAAQTILL